MGPPQLLGLAYFKPYRALTAKAKGRNKNNVLKFIISLKFTIVSTAMLMKEFHENQTRGNGASTSRWDNSVPSLWIAFNVARSALLIGDLLC